MDFRDWVLMLNEYQDDFDDLKKVNIYLHYKNTETKKNGVLWFDQIPNVILQWDLNIFNYIPVDEIRTNWKKDTYEIHFIHLYNSEYMMAKQFNELTAWVDETWDENEEVRKTLDYSAREYEGETKQCI